MKLSELYAMAYRAMGYRVDFPCYIESHFPGVFTRQQIRKINRIFCNWLNISHKFFILD